MQLGLELGMDMRIFKTPQVILMCGQDLEPLL